MNKLTDIYSPYSYILFIGEENDESYSPEYFAAHSEHIVLDDFGTLAPYLTARDPRDSGTHRHVFSWDADASEHDPSAVREG